MTKVTNSQWQSILEEEEALWRRGHPCFEASDHHETQFSLLDQCPNISRIHGYFSNLELRKCCLKLAGANTTFSTMRVVNSSSRTSFTSQTANGLWVSRQKENSQLTDRDFAVYRSTLLCANFPVLSVPDPPTEPSPTSSVAWESRVERRSAYTESSLTGRRAYTRQMSHLSPIYSHTEDVRGKASTTPAELFDSFRYKVQHQSMEAAHSRSNSQTSGIDSLCSASSMGYMDEEDAMAVLPAESLCEWLRRMFGLNQDAARLYEKKIYEPHRKKTFAKILVEELCKQLSMLESDSHPFYNSNMFMSRESYKKWQHHERARIGQMIQKFWHHSLPTVKSSSHLEVAQYHEHYRHLLRKMVTFEGSLRSSLSGGHTGCEMSSVSRRLLKEFSYRHGIGDYYQRIVFLELMKDNFSSHMTYTQKLNGQLLELRQLLPRQMAKSVLIATEYEILTGTLAALQTHCKQILTRIKRIFEEDQILKGVNQMIQLLALLVELKAQLDVDNSPTVKQLLRVYTKENLHGCYERHKLIARGDLELDPKKEDITPKLIHRLILNIKDEVADYKRNYAPAYQRYLDVVHFSAGVLYDLLMEDVTSLCVVSNQKDESPGIRLTLLGLVYRLDQLDRDPCWQQLVSPVQQTWRREFFSLILKWVRKLQQHAEKFLLQCIATDTFVTLKPVMVPDREDHLVAGSRCTSTQSHVSIAVSEFSAFSAFRNQCSPASREVSLADHHTSASSLLAGREADFEDCDLGEQILTFQSMSSTTTRVHSRPAHGRLLATELMGDRCASEPYKFVSFDCGNGREGAELARSREDMEIPENIGVATEVKNGDNHEESRNAMAGHTVDQTSVQEQFEPNHGLEQNTVKQLQATGDVNNQLAFTGTRKLRSQSMRDELMKSTPQCNESAFEFFNIPEVQSTLPIIPSLPAPCAQHAPASVLHNRPDVEHALLEEDNTEIGNKPPGMSSSAVEVVLVLKRLTHTVKTLCDTVYPNQRGPCTVEESPGGTGRDAQAEEMVIHVKQNVIMRWKLYTSLQEIIHDMVTLYTYNMLSMDLCGESNLRAKQTVGTQVVDELKVLHREKRLWGCRHMLTGNNCKAYAKKKKVTYLADKYEAVTREMCTRVNNLVELSALVEDLFSSARQSLCLYRTIEAARGCDMMLEDDSFVVCQKIKQQVAEGWLALLHLMVHRLTLFVKEAMTMLQNLEVAPTASMESIYHPVIRFIKNYSIALTAWLNEEVYVVLMKHLWDKLIHLFEEHVNTLISKEKMYRLTAERLLQLIAHLMKLLCGKDGKLDLDYAESRAERCLDILSLCTSPTIRLILIYRILRMEFEVSDVEAADTDSQPIPPKSYLQAMYKDLHQTRKCFTGSQLVNWIMHHPLQHLAGDTTQNPTTSKHPSGTNTQLPSTHLNDEMSDTSMNNANNVWRVNKGNSPLTGFDLARAQNVAKLMLKKGIIYRLDSSSRGSLVHQSDIYPDVVHYATSSLSKLRSYSCTQGLNHHTANSDGAVLESSSDIWRKRPVLPRNISAPQFSLGVGSPIDVTVLKSELEFRQVQTQFVSDSDSGTEGALTLNEKTRRRIEKLMQQQQPVDSSSGEVDQTSEAGKVVNLALVIENITPNEETKENSGKLGSTSESSISSSTTTVEVHSESKLMQDNANSILYDKVENSYTGDAIETAENLPESLSAAASMCENRTAYPSSKTCDLVATAEMHSIQLDPVTEPVSGNLDISEAIDQGISALTGENIDMSGNVRLNCNTLSSEESDKDASDKYNSLPGINRSPLSCNPAWCSSRNSSDRPEGIPINCDNQSGASSRYSPDRPDHTSHSSVPAGAQDCQNSVVSGEYGLSSSLSSFSSRNAFQSTNDHFYSFSDGTEHLAECLEHIISFLDHMTSAEGESFQKQLSSDIDHFQKEHPCFGYQFSTQHLQPKFLLNILKCRKYHDYVAKHFLLLLPRDQRLEYDLSKESIKSGCFRFF